MFLTHTDQAHQRTGSLEHRFGGTNSAIGSSVHVYEVSIISRGEEDPHTMSLLYRYSSSFLDYALGEMLHSPLSPLYLFSKVGSLSYPFKFQVPTQDGLGRHPVPVLCLYLSFCLHIVDVPSGPANHVYLLLQKSWVIVPPELGYPDNDYNKSGPRPTTFSGQRALDFVLKNQGLIDKTLLFDIELLKIMPN
ncbi:hypothetical protein IFM89_002981 [Coptis chinensis]|uniref:Uncharacterized protein n=1 Tax=Coptis chinensis TaxID=261450 RepID=A0A835MCR7_9MAGN|nr:hypothetical protein IFM89_002981 [Coptis chinensis]